MSASGPDSGDFFDLHGAEPARVRRAKEEFRRLAHDVLRAAGAAEAAVGALSDRLWELMSGPGRHYHTPVHVLTIFAVARKLGIDLDTDEELALLFHDAVYHARGAPGQSESDSADLVAELLPRAGVPVERCERAAAAIRSTAEHAADEVPPEHALVLDLDLAGLASDPDSFRRQSEALRREMTHLSPDEYRRSTLALLQKLLARPRIYRTSALAALEPAARDNVERETRRLNGSGDTG